MDSAGRSRGCPIRKFPDQSVFPAPRDLSQVTTSFIASVCQGIRREPFVAWPYNLQHACCRWNRFFLIHCWIKNQTLDCSTQSKERDGVSALAQESTSSLKRMMHPWEMLYSFQTYLCSCQGSARTSNQIINCLIIWLEPSILSTKFN